MHKAAGRIKTSIVNRGDEYLGKNFIFIPEWPPRAVSIITFCCVRIRIASFLAINRRGCDVNSPGRRSSILQVCHTHLTDISSAFNHFFA